MIGNQENPVFLRLKVGRNFIFASLLRDVAFSIHLFLLSVALIELDVSLTDVTKLLTYMYVHTLITSHIHKLPEKSRLVHAV